MLADQKLLFLENNIIWNEDATKFEAGTPNVAGVIGMGASIDFMENIGMDVIHNHVSKCTENIYNGLNLSSDQLGLRIWSYLRLLFAVDF